MPLRMHLLDYNLQKCRKGKQKGLKMHFLRLLQKIPTPLPSGLRRKISGIEGLNFWRRGRSRNAKGGGRQNLFFVHAPLTLICPKVIFSISIFLLDQGRTENWEEQKNEKMSRIELSIFAVKSTGHIFEFIST